LHRACLVLSAQTIYPHIIMVENMTNDQLNNLIHLDLLDAFEERAAIMQYDGGMSREDAEHAAYKDVMTKSV